MRSLVLRLSTVLLLVASTRVVSADDFSFSGDAERFQINGRKEETARPISPRDTSYNARQPAVTPLTANSPASASPEPTSLTLESGEGLSLAPPRERQKKTGSRPQPKTPARAMGTVVGSLAIVLGSFFLLVWFTRRALPRAATSLPKEIVEVLGRTPLNGRHNMHLVRVGNKVLLLSVTPTGAETLTEITDIQEIDRITGICQQDQPGSISQTFRQVMSHFESEPAPGGFLGETSDTDSEFIAASEDA